MSPRFYLSKAMLVFMFVCKAAFANESFSIHEPIVVEAGLSEGSKSLRSYLSDNSQFSYFDEQSLGASSSVFYQGLDQRFVDVSLNGFALTDASTPLGAFNLSQISGLRGLQAESFKTSSSINLKTIQSDKTSKIFVSGSQLGEGSVSLDLNQKIFNFKVGFNRAGGFNQTVLGDEKDSTLDKYLLFDFTKKFSGFEWSSHIFFDQQEQDYDSLFDSVEDAEAESDFFLIGQKLIYNDFKLQLSYKGSKRSFREGSETLKFKGENIEAEVFFKEWIAASFEKESNRSLDDELFKLKLTPEKRLSLKFLWSDLRGSFFDVEANPIKTFGIFYKEIPASLFQLNFDTSVELRKQRSFGFKSYKDFVFDKLELEFNALFQRAFDQIEFSPTSFTYVNFERSETLFSSVSLSYLSYGLYFQAQRAKNLVQNLDLPRRSRWVLGFDYERALGMLRLDFGLKWNSSMKAFDQSKISSFWVSDLGLEYKSLRFVVKNVLNQKNQIFRDFKRRPTTFELQYSYEF